MIKDIIVEKHGWKKGEPIKPQSFVKTLFPNTEAAQQTYGVGPNYILDTAKMFGVMPEYYFKWRMELQQLTNKPITELDPTTLQYLAACHLDNQIRPADRKELPGPRLPLRLGLSGEKFEGKQLRVSL